MAKSIKLISLGGYGEIGKNMTAIETNSSLLLIDAGILFPSSFFPGIDYIIPDISYLKKKIDKFKGILITHGHEDHIGAIPYILKELRYPTIYGKKLSIELIKKKLSEHDIEFNNYVIVDDKNKKFTLGDIDAEFVHMNHSIPDASAIFMKTGNLKIFFTGDFKLDYTPINEPFIDLHRIAAIGKSGVDLLIVDSTNAPKKGMSNSEKTVGLEMDKIVARIKGRIIMATFATNLSRIIQIFDVARKNNRKVVVEGRSLKNIIEIASRLGYLDLNGIDIISINDYKKYEDWELLFLVTGSQGEPMSVLQRISQNMHSKIKIKKGDTVLISAKVIPGNEIDINRMINNLFKRGAEVSYENISEIHVSGHAAQEDIKLITKLLMPKFVIPYHGEYQNMIALKKIMNYMGYPDKNIMLIENGDAVELKKNSIKKLKRVVYGKKLIENSFLGEVDESVIADRKMMGQEGVIFLIFSYNKKTGELLSELQMLSVGIKFDEKFEKLIKKRFVDILHSLSEEELGDINMLKIIIARRLRRFIKKRTYKEPVVVSHILEVK